MKRPTVGDQVFSEEGSEEFGAVRAVYSRELLVYIENAGDFRVPLGAVQTVHDGKVVLDLNQTDSGFRAAVRRAHDLEEPGM